jgi:hypothetical protein
MTRLLETIDSPLEWLGARWRGVVENVSDRFFGSHVPLTPDQMG